MDNRFAPLGRKIAGSQEIDFPEMQYVSKEGNFKIFSPRGGAMAVNLGGAVHTVESSELTFSLPGIIIGGGPLASKTFYYIYAVPNGSSFTLVAAAGEAPSYVGGPGPTGFPKHRYIGVLISTTVATIEMQGFTKVGGLYHLHPQLDTAQPLEHHWNDSTPTVNLESYTLVAATSRSDNLHGRGGVDYPVTPEMFKVGAYMNAPNGRTGLIKLVLNNVELEVSQMEGPANQVLNHSGETMIFADMPLNHPTSLSQFGSTAEESSISFRTGYEGFQEPEAWFRI